MTPTTEQLACIDAARNTSDNLIISALAGAAKTSTLVLMAKAMSRHSILCLAFNKKIAVEMAERLPGNCQSMTLNSLGHRVWGQTIGKRLSVDTKKNYDILSALCEGLAGSEKEEAYDCFADMLKAIEFGKSCGYVPSGHFPQAAGLMNDDTFFAHLDEEPTRFFADLVRAASLESIKQGFAGKIDFDDQILLPTVFKSAFPQFPVVMIDEAQDLSALNHATLRRLARKRLIAVGDECQPAGTLVSVVERVADSWNARKIKQVPIEELKIGDRLVGYDTSYSEFMFNRKVNGVTAKPFDGKLIKIITPQGISKYTPNHHCFANFSRLRTHTALYLMRFGQRWRIGIAAMDYKQSSGPVARARSEGADALWILATFPTKQEALAAETTIQAAYGVPDITFQHAGVHTNGYHAPEVLKSVWNKLDNVDFTSRAYELLHDFNRNSDYPFWKPGQKYGTVKRPMVVHACNLLPGGEMLPYTGKKREKLSDWQNYELRYENYTGLVYSLTVSHNHLYIADGLVTHNCQAIYGFRGAHEESMDLLQQTFSMRRLTLSTSFRCPQSVVREARWRASHMQWPEWAVEGEVKRLFEWGPTSLPDNTAIICRNNAPIFSLALRLIRAKRRPEIIGNDIGKNLVKILKKFGDTSMPRIDVLLKIKEWEETKLKKSRSKKSVGDQADCLRVFASEGNTLGAIIAFAEALMSQTGPIKMMTGHKSKGLEFDHVFFLDEHLIDLEEGQERNLRYVIQTRAKQTLTYVRSDDYSEKMV